MCTFPHVFVHMCVCVGGVGGGRERERQRETEYVQACGQSVRMSGSRQEEYVCSTLTYVTVMNTRVRSDT